MENTMNPPSESNMRQHGDDPRLTAYALGELSPEDAALVETMLLEAEALGDATLRDAIEEIRQTAELVQSELLPPALVEAGLDSLGDEGRAKILEVAAGPQPLDAAARESAYRSFRWQRWTIAASLLAVVALWSALPDRAADQVETSDYAALTDSSQPAAYPEPAAAPGGSGAPGRTETLGERALDPDQEVWLAASDGAYAAYAGRAGARHDDPASGASTAALTTTLGAGSEVKVMLPGIDVEVAAPPGAPESELAAGLSLQTARRGGHAEPQPGAPANGQAGIRTIARVSNKNIAGDKNSAPEGTLTTGSQPAPPASQLAPPEDLRTSYAGADILTISGTVDLPELQGGKFFDDLTTGLPSGGGVQQGFLYSSTAAPDTRGRIELYYGDSHGSTTPVALPPVTLPPVQGNDPGWSPTYSFERYPGGESYDLVYGKPFARVADEPLSTFSLDVDTASYSNVRRMLAEGILPPPGSVRIEEMVNSFDYDWPAPEGDAPLAVDVEVSACPWAPGHQLVRIGVKAKEVERDNRQPANLVFLIDVSGSMKPMNRLPLLKQSMKLLLGELLPTDRVGIVVFAGSARVALPSTPVGEKSTILAALDSLSAEGSTNGASGIELAYATAAEARALEVYSGGGIHRVILASDGDFNTGMTDRADLVKLIEDKARSGVFLSILGFGMGNLKDATMEDLSNRGNGNYAYIDSLEEAERALVYEVMGTLMTVAKDVKVQVEMNPAEVDSYRLVGYHNRAMAAAEFNDDAKDAGDVGAGHTVTAFYEVAPVGSLADAGVDSLRYQSRSAPRNDEFAGELLTLKLRYKEPDGDESKLLTVTARRDEVTKYSASSADTRFAAAVAAFGMLLDGSPHAGNATFAQILELAGAAIGEDEHGQRKEFLALVERARALTGN